MSELSDLSSFALILPELEIREHIIGRLRQKRVCLNRYSVLKFSEVGWHTWLQCLGIGRAGHLWSRCVRGTHTAAHTSQLSPAR